MRDVNHILTELDNYKSLVSMHELKDELITTALGLEKVVVQLRKDVSEAYRKGVSDGLYSVSSVSES